MCAKQRKLKTAIIGCGRISVMYFPSLEASDTAQLVACCDIKADRAQQKAKEYGIRCYTDYREMFEKEQLDAVYLCLPHYLHIPVALEAFEKGIHALSEKPMAIDLESAEMAVKRARELGVQYGVIFQCRYNPSSQLVKKAVMEGKLGRILTARSILTWSRSDDYYSQSDWKGTWDKEGGGVIIDQAIHSIDLVNWIIDSEMESVSCSMANRGHEIVQVEDCAEGLITYRSGVKYGFYAMNNYGWDEPIEIRLLCEKGKAVFGYDDACITYDDGTVEEVHRTEELQEVCGAKTYWGMVHAVQIEQFHRACLGLEPLEISGEEALKTHRLIMELYDKGGMKNKA